MIRKRFSKVTTLIGVLSAVGCSTATAPVSQTPGGGPVPGTTTPPAPVSAVGAPKATTPAGVAGAGSMTATPNPNTTAPTPNAGAMPVPGMGQAPNGAQQTTPAAGTPDMPISEAAPSGPKTGKCDGGSLMPGDANMMIEIEGANRTFTVHTPASYDGTKPMPLVVNFHPLSGTSGGQRSGSGWAQLGDTEGFITAFPQGIGNQWDIGGLKTRGDGTSDRKLAVAVVAEVAKIGCVDLKRVYASGYSMGGGLTHYVGCTEANTFAAIAPSAFDIIMENMPCEPARPMTVIMFRGRSDPIVPWEPSVGTLTGCCATFLGAEGCFAEWAKIDGCTDMPKDIGNSCQRYEACKDGTQVTLCENGSHTQGDAKLSWDAIKAYSLP